MQHQFRFLEKDAGFTFGFRNFPQEYYKLKQTNRSNYLISPGFKDDMGIIKKNNIFSMIIKNLQLKPILTNSRLNHQ